MEETEGEKISENPFCEDCYKTGVLTEATEVHHIVPVESVRDPQSMTALAFDPHNIVSLCRECHIERHRQLKSHSMKERQRRMKADCEEFWKAFG